MFYLLGHLDSSKNAESAQRLNFHWGRGMVCQRPCTWPDTELEQFKRLLWCCWNGGMLVNTFWHSSITHN